MILGRDFMKAYKVVIDHGTDEICIYDSLDLIGVYWPQCLSTIDENGDFKVKVIKDFNLELTQGGRVDSVTENFN
jgi:hypothetical protein